MFLLLLLPFVIRRVEAESFGWHAKIPLTRVRWKFFTLEWNSRVKKSIHKRQRLWLQQTVHDFFGSFKNVCRLQQLNDHEQWQTKGKKIVCVCAHTIASAHRNTSQNVNCTVFPVHLALPGIRAAAIDQNKKIKKKPKQTRPQKQIKIHKRKRIKSHNNTTKYNLAKCHHPFIMVLVTIYILMIISF